MIDAGDVRVALASLVTALWAGFTIRFQDTGDSWPEAIFWGGAFSLIVAVMGLLLYALWRWAVG